MSFHQCLHMSFHQCLRRTTLGGRHYGLWSHPVKTDIQKNSFNELQNAIGICIFTSSCSLNVTNVASVIRHLTICRSRSNINFIIVSHSFLFCCNRASHPANITRTLSRYSVIWSSRGTNVKLKHPQLESASTRFLTASWIYFVS